MGEKLERLKPLSLFLLRAVMGAVFMAHGYPKLFKPSAQLFEAFGRWGFPAWAVYLAGAVEFFGGALLVLGLFTRFAALLLSGQMAVAFLKAHYPRAAAEKGLLGFLGRGGDEFPLVLCAAAFALLTLGAGIISVDALLFGKKKARPAKA